jgi:hypothetical protein
MPRLDNSDRTVIVNYDLDFDEADPGKTPPVDLCDECGSPWLNTGLCIDHPDYEDDDYLCAECGRVLGAWDN